MKNVEKNLDEMRQELFLTVTNLLQEGPYLFTSAGCYYEEVFKQLNKYYKALHK